MCKRHDWQKWISLAALLFLGLQGISMANMHQASIQSSQGTIQTSDAMIWYKKFYTQASQDQIPVICLHGGPGFPHNYMLKLQEVARSRPVIFYDQSGCGNSKVKDDNFKNWTLEHYLQELDEVVNQLGYDKIFLLGSSWGGTLAAQYALRHHNKLAGLILASPLLNTHDWVQDCKQLAATLPTQIYRTIMEHEAAGTTHEPVYHEAIAVLYNNFSCRLTPKPEEYLQSCRGMSMDVYQTMWGPSEMTATGNLKNFDMIDQLSDIKIPTLITCGRYDMATPHSMQRYAQLIPDNKLVVFEKSAHVAFAEEQELYVQVVSEFMDEINQIKI